MDQQAVAQKLYALITAALDDEGLAEYMGELKAAGVIVQAGVELQLFFPHGTAESGAEHESNAAAFDEKFAKDMRIQL